MDQSIKIRIAGQEYSLKAGSPEIERLMRLAAESVSKKVEPSDYSAPPDASVTSGSPPDFTEMADDEDAGELPF